MVDSHSPNTPGNHGVLDLLRSLGRRIATIVSILAAFTIRTVLPKLRIGCRAAGRALRTWGVALAAGCAAAVRALVAFLTQLAADMRPSKTHQSGPTSQHTSRPADRSRSANGRSRSAAAASSTSSAMSASPVQHDMHHVYLVRRVVVFGAMALAAVVLVAAIVSGVRALIAPSSSAASAQSTSGQQSKHNGDDAAQSDKNADNNAGADADASDGQSSAIKPLTDQERDDILAAAQQTVADSGNTPVEYTYCIASQGDVGDLTEFSNTVYSTLNDPRGWPRAGATFQEAANEDNGDGSACDMTLMLATPDQMTTFSTECSDEYSCRVGNDVIINIDRWNNATEDWLNAGGTVERYRTMVINHEVGHRLGHLDNETTCRAMNQPAPLMQQQSMDLLGCTPNEWPLDDELWVNE